MRRTTKIHSVSTIRLTARKGDFKASTFKKCLMGKKDSLKWKMLNDGFCVYHCDIVMSRKVLPGHEISWRGIRMIRIISYAKHEEWEITTNMKLSINRLISWSLNPVNNFFGCRKMFISGFPLSCISRNHLITRSPKTFARSLSRSPTLEPQSLPQLFLIPCFLIGAEEPKVNHL